MTNLIHESMIFAMTRWPQATANTKVIAVPVGVTVYEVPVTESFNGERIELHRCIGIKGVMALGYGPETDTLMVGMAE